jgi:hypothetical protein
LQQGWVQLTQFLPKKVSTGKGALDVKAIVGAVIELEIKAQFNEKPRMFEQKVAQLLGVDQAFFDTDDEGGCQ